MSMVDELLVNTLKSYVPIKDYDLHDWETIISRSWKYNDNVTVYPLVYADLYLTDELEFYDVDPKQPNKSFLEDKVFTDDLLVSVLKSYVPSKDWELHDWETIISRREHYKNDVFIYKLVFADIYLTEDLEFYSVETKQPNNRVIKQVDDEESIIIINSLCNYLPYKYREDVDWGVILSRQEKINENITKYTINHIDLYLDNELNLVEYGKVHIIDNNIYYDFEVDSDKAYDGYVWFGEL